MLVKEVVQRALSTSLERQEEAGDWTDNVFISSPLFFGYLGYVGEIDARA